MSLDVGAATAAAVDDQTFRSVERFLYREAELVDARRFDEWLELFADDLEYRAPIRVWRDDFDRQPDPVACYFNDTKQTLAIRVQRIATGLAWTESPPSVTRHFVSNLRVTFGSEPDLLTARTNLLVTRSRGPNVLQEIFSADRVDTMRGADGDLQIARRIVTIDSTMLSAQNLAIFF